MSKPEHIDYEGFGERFQKELNHSQTVHIGDRIEVSGQGGWDRITEEIPGDLGAEVDQTFENIEHALKQAGGTGLD
ncbi:hypothetical protein EK21DRAFT_113157 [Setomelanomma holmii]|uniref:Uncharacterized protein n=1 Tax=Setomelanomma holmii TaxID=210430 RepID=A0A9P4H6X7_9PLEO|nr:hypothetical protein EK21DRAFT_113157 [Setomelanomma holmii]